MTDDKNNETNLNSKKNSTTPASLSKIKKITSAPTPITPLDPKPLYPDLMNQQLSPIVPINGIELMKRWATTADAIILLSYERLLFPILPEKLMYNKVFVTAILATDNISKENFLAKCIYDQDIIDVIEFIYPEHLVAIRKDDVSPGTPETVANNKQKQHDTEPKPAPQPDPQADNSFKRNVNGDYWTICFQGKESSPIKNVNGLRYIAYLLERPGTSIQSVDFYNVVTGNDVDKTIDESTAIDDGLTVGNKKQSKNDHKAKNDYLKELDKLEGLKNDYQQEVAEGGSDAETIMIQLEYVDGMMKELQRKLNERNFPNDSTKKQSLINGLLKTAYKNIKADHNMEKCVDHFEKYINTDGMLGFIYNGGIKWQIFL